MTPPAQHSTTLAPDHGIGYYSDDHERWWDERQQRWFPVGREKDTLEIELEADGGASWLTNVITTVGSPFAIGAYRFVAVAHSQDSRWPTYRVVGETFVETRAFLADIPQPEAWSSAMTASLRGLRDELAEHGWILTGRRSDPWSYRYVRPCIDPTPTDQPRGGMCAEAPVPSLTQQRRPDRGGHPRPAPSGDPTTSTPPSPS